MYYLFEKHNLLPGDYFRLPAGEQLVIRAFFEAKMDAVLHKGFGSDFAAFVNQIRR